MLIDRESLSKSQSSAPMLEILSPEGSGVGNRVMDNSQAAKVNVKAEKGLNGVWTLISSR